MNDVGLDPKDYGSTWGSDGDSGSSGDDGCFLTTACVRARGLPDDCEELTILRQYRDTSLKNRNGGETDIREYYKLAPTIVDRVNQKSDAKEIWNAVYENMILPCIEMIRQNRMESAYELYKSYTLRLMEI